MVLVHPFRGFRYNKEVVGDLNLVVTQPYDKMTPAMQETYYRLSPYNAVRITLNLEKRENADTDYSLAGATFRQWIDQKILVQDPLPAIYVYCQEYTLDGQKYTRKGFTALLDLRDSAARIFPHEQTLTSPKFDRLRLMRSLEANDDFIHMLYTDNKLTVNHLLQQSISGKNPEIEVRDEYETIHRLWAVTDFEVLGEIRKAMDSKDFFIADGHHRFETSVSFMKECEQKKWKPAAVESFDKRMVTCFNSADGVTILATHRLLRNIPEFDPNSFLQAVGRHFHVIPAASPVDLWKEMTRAQQETVFGFYPASLRKFYLLKLKEQSKQDPVLGKFSDAYRRLDVTVLHALILNHYLGIDENKLAAESHVDYGRDREDCIRLADEGRYQAVFFLNPTTAEQMLQIASMGERMPQKSTDFFPKLLTGLLFMKMEIAK